MATTPTASTLQGIEPGAFKTVCKVNPLGALQARKQASGAVGLYWRYSHGTHSERVAIGLLDPTAPPKSLTPTTLGYSVAAAIRAAEVLAIEHHQHRKDGGRPALVSARREAKAAAEAEHQRAAKATLSALLDAYCDQLKALGRRSHQDARGIFRMHVKEAWPKLASAPAKSLTSEQAADMMRRLVEAGKGRTANKLRSYGRAAYAMAAAARSKASIPVAFKSFGITHNPFADTQPDEAHNRPDKRPLSAEELGIYWRAIKAMDGIQGAVLRLHLLTGGQRIEQLVNLKTSDIEADRITLHDKKGRPGQAPRPHVVPLLTEAKAALKKCAPAGEFALSTDGGATHIAATTVTRWAADAARDQIAEFQAKRIRSGVETLLASAGVSREIRGRLQSHGIAGVQQRSYDAHDYLPEKRTALEALVSLIGRPRRSTVTPIRRRRA